MQEVFKKIKEMLEEEVKYQNEEAELAPPFCELTFDKARRKMAECYEHAIEIVNQVAEEYVGKTDTFGNSEQVNKGWIPCSERLPEEKEAIYVYEGSIEPIELIVQIEGAEIPSVAFFVDGEFKHPFESEGYGFAAEVIAWQPLPEPYKGE